MGLLEPHSILGDFPRRDFTLLPLASASPPITEVMCVRVCVGGGGVVAGEFAFWSQHSANLWGLMKHNVSHCYSYLWVSCLHLALFLIPRSLFPLMPRIPGCFSPACLPPRAVPPPLPPPSRPFLALSLLFLFSLSPSLPPSLLDLLAVMSLVPESRLLSASLLSSSAPGAVLPARAAGSAGAPLGWRMRGQSRLWEVRLCFSEWVPAYR